MALYDVYLDHQVVGKVNIERIGLYYSVKCKCQLQKGELYKLYWKNSSLTRKIGVCIPNGDSMEVHTKVPVSCVGNGDYSFFISSKEDTERIICPVEVGQPFSSIDKLRYGRFYVGECTGIVICEENVNYQKKNP